VIARFVAEVHGALHIVNVTPIEHRRRRGYGGRCTCGWRAGPFDYDRLRDEIRRHLGCVTL